MQRVLLSFLLALFWLTIRAASPLLPDSPPAEVLQTHRSVKHPKLSTQLAALSRAVPQQRGSIPPGQRIAPPPGFSIETLPKSVQDAIRAKTMRINQNGEVQVYILVSRITEENLQKIRAAGATVERHDKPQRIVQARVPVTRLEEVAALPFVQFVRLPDYGVRRTGSVNTQGDSVLRADLVRSNLGVSGTGVRVGVISSGIAGVFATGCNTCGPTTASPSPIATGDLPNAVGARNASGVLVSVSGGITARSFRADGDLEDTPDGPEGAEGTAMLEIVQDLASGAQLFFANAETSLDFNEAVNFLVSQTDIVADDIGFPIPPFDGTNLVSSNTAKALNNDANPIRAYFTSVGNVALHHYEEPFVDSGVDGTARVGQPGDLHRFQATTSTNDLRGLGPRVFNPFLLSAGRTVTIVLTWNDPFSGSGNDYDLFLVQDTTGAVVAFSNDPQTGTQPPVEALSFTNNTGADAFFDIVIQNFNNSAAPRTFDFFLLGIPDEPQNVNFNTVGGSVMAEADAGGSPVKVMSVGAVNWQTPDTIEPFSSNGPTLDGRMKPDITAVDGVSITGAGGFGNSPSGTFPQTFFGTSAASPHGAGVAALVLQASPCLVAGSSGARTPVDARTILRGLLTGTAVDLGAAGPDNVFGFGRLDALAAASLVIPTANAGLNQTANASNSSGASVTLNGTGSSDPNACPLTFSWAGDCGSATGATPSVNCSIGVNRMTLAVTNNNVTLSAPSSVQIAVTDFTLAPSPTSTTIRAGQTANYTINLSPQFGPFTNPISLSCSNLPALSSCSFSPTAVTPGPNVATATMTISTTAASALLRPPSEWPRPGSVVGLLVGLLTLVAMGFALSMRRTRERFSAYLLLEIVVAFLAFQVACGGGGGAQSFAPTRPGTPSGTFSITVTGAAGSLQHSTTATLVVQ